MPYNKTSRLWPDESESFFRSKSLTPIQQIGPHCVSTVLAMLTGETPDVFQGADVNTQDPVSWSRALTGWSMKLAYCPTDVRKLKYYMAELVEIDDLFTLSYFSSVDPDEILGEPNDHGWVTSSHIVILHGGKILDPASGCETSAFEHGCNDRHTKRVFRVVPSSHVRGL